MTMTNMQALAFALIPGQAETVKHYAYNNLAWQGLALGVIYSRNTVFAGIVLTAIGLKGAKMSVDESKKMRRYACRGAASLGVGLTILGSRSLHYYTKYVQNVVNSKHERDKIYSRYQ